MDYNYNENNGFSTQNNEEDTNSYQFSDMPAQVVLVEKELKPKKRKNNIFKRGVALVLSAAIFGTVAGGSFYGVNSFLESQNPEAIPAEDTNTISQNQILPAVNGQNLSVSQVAEKSTNALVSITNSGVQAVQSFFGTEYQEAASSSSGIIVKETEDEIFIATNYHVVENSIELAVTFYNDASVNATYKGGDKNNDIAVISVKKADIDSNTLNSIAVIPMGNSEEIVIGEQVVAIGNALGYGLSVTSGYVSALDRPVTLENNYSVDMIQTDAAINPGNSGGALINMQGELIGINTAKTAQTDVEGIGYAIPISDVQTLINELIELPDKVAEEEIGYLGVYTSSIDPAVAESYNVPLGAFVQGVDDGTPAKKGGVQEKDIITKVDGYDISSSDDLAETLSYYKAGTKISLTVQRPEGNGYNELVLDITLGSRE